MIKEILEQLAPLDAQIAALKGSGNDMDALTAHASELAELAVEEDEILRTCGPLTAEDRVFLARHPERLIRPTFGTRRLDKMRQHRIRQRAQDNKCAIHVRCGVNALSDLRLAPPCLT